MKIRVLSGLVVLAIFVATPVARADFFADNFDRANSVDLGANWDLVTPTTQIVDNRATNSVGGFGMSMVSLANFDDPYQTHTASADVSVGAVATEYVALLIGHNCSGYQ